MQMLSVKLEIEECTKDLSPCFSKILSFHCITVLTPETVIRARSYFGKKSRFFPWNRCMLLFHRIIIVALPETEVKRKFIPAKQFSQKNLVKSMWYVIVAVSFETSS